MVSISRRLCQKHHLFFGSATVCFMFDGLTYPLPASETRILVCTSCDGKNRLPLHRALEQPDKARCGRCGKPLLIAKESPLRVTGTTIRHPLDQKASEALEAVPGVSTLLRKLVEVTSERYDRLFNQSSYVRVTFAPVFPMCCASLKKSQRGCH